ncbi:MAG: hypothetical protein COA82_11890 [Alkaliphilus sp.]|nr:hypothetical protein [bacterium AH-315-E09]PHS30050.1 MAG: hypothetical protein COA82_11890 [Alkaliphilus sp.]
MARLDKEFKTFYSEEVKYYANKEIRDKKNKLKTDFKSNFPTKFKEYFDDEFKAENIRFIDQGSYAIGTTINHGNKAFDIDVATILDIDVTKYSNPVEIKKIARDSLSSTNRNPIIKEPCITVKYTKEGEEKYHVDFPVYANHNGRLYLARGYEYSSEENRKWELADPEGLNDYFKTDNLQIEGLELSGDEKEQRNQKRRLIRYFKWWKAEKYSNPQSDNEVPPSIALTILVCKYFKYSKIDEKYNDLDSLYKTVNKIIEEIFYDGYDTEWNEIKKIRNCNLPTIPNSDCFSNLKNSDNYVKKFYDKMEYFKNQLEIAVNESNERKAGESICKVFGEKFPLPEEDKANEEDSFAE